MTCTFFKSQQIFGPNFTFKVAESENKTGNGIRNEIANNIITKKLKFLPNFLHCFIIEGKDFKNQEK